MELFIVGTSYAPGHNFWPGSPFSWWVRGILAFALVAGPQLAALTLVAMWFRRRRTWSTFAIGVAACTVTYVLWPDTIGLSFRDGDMPWFIGLQWGDVARPCLLALSMIGAAVATVFKRRESRGFPVILEQNSTLARQSAHSNP